MMRHFSFLILTLLMATMASAQPLFVGTYNIRYHNPDDDSEGNVWAVRGKAMCDLLNFEDPDVFGTYRQVIIP